MEHRDLHFHQHQLQEEYGRYYKPSFICEARNSTNLSSFTEKGKEYNMDLRRSSGEDDMLVRDEVADNYLTRLSEMMNSHLPSSCVNDSDRDIVTGRREIWPAGICLTDNKTTSDNTLLAAAASSSSSLSSSRSNLSTLEEMPPSLLLSCSLGFTSHMLLSSDPFGLYDMQHRENSPSNSSNKISGVTCGSGLSREKTSRSWSQGEEYEARAKKSRSTATPYPTLKVRKEKLGDRIQTLQRLVAPFGKTNTASVLNETIGYIHFLHDQIQTLSIPYMKSWKARPFGKMQLSLDSREEKCRETKPDLRSSGLCLVPLSCASYISS